MNFIDFQEGLQNLTNTKITQSDIARMLNVGRANIHDRIKRNSSVTTDEVEYIQNFLGVNLFIRTDNPDINISDNSCKRIFDETIPQKLETCGARLGDIQEKNKLSQFQMAGLLGISEIEYAEIIIGEKLPNVEVLNNIKQNFKVSIDWLLYGE